MKTVSRKYEVDMVRAFAIILIMIGHFFQGYRFVDYIYIFHVPLFFFISGYVFDTNKSIKSFLQSRVRSMVVPYICFGAIIIMATYLFSQEYTIYSLGKIIIKYCLQQRYTTMWFLTALFFAEFFFLLLYKLANKVMCFNRQRNIALISMVVLITIAMCCYEKIINYALPLTFDIGILCIIFVATDCFFRMYGDNHLHGIPIGLIMFVIGMILGIISLWKSGERVDICYGILGIPYLSIPASLLCSSGLLLIFRECKNIKIISFVGCHTMTVFALHQMVFKQIFLKLLKFQTPLLIVVSICITLVVCVMLDAYLSKSKYSFIIGKRVN